MGDGRLAGAAGRAGRFRDGIAPVLLAAALLAFPGAAPAQEGPSFAPCLAVRDSAEAYARAFEEAGWTRATGEARAQALRPLSEILYWMLNAPPPAETQEELLAARAQAHAYGEEHGLKDHLILTKGDVALGIRLDGSMSGGVAVECFLAAADLPEADPFLIGADDWLTPGLTVSHTRLPVPEKASGLEVWAIRYDSPLPPDEPFLGREGLSVRIMWDHPS